MNIGHVEWFDNSKFRMVDGGQNMILLMGFVGGWGWFYVSILICCMVYTLARMC